MKTSETVGKIAAAMAIVQGALEPAKKTSDNPFFGSKYADLSAIVEACRKLLCQNNIAVFQTPEGDGTVLSLTTRLVHSSGEWVEGTLAMKPAKLDPQGTGSAITYARRYGLAAIVGIATEDDDGNSASDAAPKSKAPAKRATPERAPESGSVPIKAQAANAIRAWTGLNAEDIPKAIEQIKGRIGIKGAATDDDCRKMIDFVADRVAKGVDFVEEFK